MYKYVFWRSRSHFIVFAIINANNECEFFWCVYKNEKTRVDELMIMYNNKFTTKNTSVYILNERRSNSIYMIRYWVFGVCFILKFILMWTRLKCVISFFHSLFLKIVNIFVDFFSMFFFSLCNTQVSKCLLN